MNNDSHILFKGKHDVRVIFNADFQKWHLKINNLGYYYCKPETLPGLSRQRFDDGFHRLSG